MPVCLTLPKRARQANVNTRELAHVPMCLCGVNACMHVNVLLFSESGGMNAPSDQLLM